MVLKRVFEQEAEEDGTSFSPQSSKRGRPWLNVMREVVVAQSMQRHLSKLEPFLRRIVQEEVQTAVCHYVQSAPRPPINRIQEGATRPYRLHFKNKLPQTLFTGSKIEAEDGMPVQIVIVTSSLNEIVTSGPLSTLKIDILVLDGEFGGNEQEEWTEENFSDSVVREREGKRPLLTGELAVTLKNGVGYLGGVSFTDNSSWIRSRKFRLGAKVSQSRYAEGRIHEAVTEAFLVKDHRGELYKKNHPPALCDEVWRLEKIGKDGVFHKRLADSGINTVQDFLRFFVLDQDRLRSLLGSGMSNKTWEATVEHARECLLDNRLYSYSSGQGVVLLFDSIFQLVGAIFDHIYHPLDSLTASQKVLVNKLKVLAFKNPKSIVEISEQLVRPSRSLDMINAISYQGASSVDIYHSDQSAAQDNLGTELALQHQPSVSYNEESSMSQNMFSRHSSLSVQRFGSFGLGSFNMREFIDLHTGNLHTNGWAGSNGEHFMGFSSAVAVPSSSSTVPGDYGGVHGCGESSRSYLHGVSPGVALVSPLTTAWDQGNDMMQTFGGEARRSHSRASISSGNWVKLMAALKWVAISKRLAARRARIEDLGRPIGDPSFNTDAQVESWW